MHQFGSHKGNGIHETQVEATDARKEAVRDGVPPIKLVDGEQLIKMLESLELGLMPVQSYKVDDQFFDVYR